MGTKSPLAYRFFPFFVRLSLIPVGLWPIENANFLYRMISNTMYLVLLSMSCITLYTISKSNGNIAVLTRACSWNLSICTITLKIIICRSYRGRLLDLNKNLSATFERDIADLEMRPLLLQRLPIFRVVFYSLLTTLVGAFGFLVIRPLIMKSPAKSFSTVYPVYYPIDFENNLNLYHIIYAYESLATFFYVCILGGVDTYFGLYVFQLCGQLELLAYKFSQLRPGKEYMRELRYCIEKHEMLLKSRDHLQRIFGFMIVWLYITISLLLCEYVHKINKVGLQSWKLTLFFSMAVATKVSQAFAYAYCGSIIDIQSEKVQDSIYACNWAGTGDLRIMKDVLCMLSQRPMDYRAFNYFYVSMDMFMKIMQASTSYYFLLKLLETR